MEAEDSFTAAACSSMRTLSRSIFLEISVTAEADSVTPEAWSAIRLFTLSTLELIWLMEDAVCSMFAESSWPTSRSLEEAKRMEWIMPPRELEKELKLSAIEPISSRVATGMRWVRSPCPLAMPRSMASAFLRGFTIEADTTSTRTMNSARETRKAAAMTVPMVPRKP